MYRQPNLEIQDRTVLRFQKCAQHISPLDPSTKFRQVRMAPTEQRMQNYDFLADREVMDRLACGYTTRVLDNPQVRPA